MATPRWWETSVLYELLIPAFQDSNGDGCGDLPGVTQRIDYLTELGVGAVWLSPFYASPMYDVGYDVEDYCRVDPRFGTFQDFQELLSAAHERGLRVVIDYVPNHTSRNHPWFQQSRASRHARNRDWYLWADPRPGGGPPNNWINRFGDSAWTLDAGTDQYYFGTFAPEQPDLNWRHPEVRQAMFDVLRFWLELGVDGVRVDALPHLIKDRGLRNNPLSLSYSEDQDPTDRQFRAYSQNQPELLELLSQLRQVVDEYPERVLIGEAYQLPEQIAAYQAAGVHLVLDTAMLQGPFSALPLRQIIDRVEAITPKNACPSRSGGNHDIPRLAERVGPKNLRLAVLLQFTVRGGATMYYGDELGLGHIAVPSAKIRDPSGRANPRYGRDRFRVPMPWDRGPHAGFSSVEPWLPIDQRSLELNVADQEADRGSLLHFYRRVLRLRATEPALQGGDYWPIDSAAPVLAFGRGKASGPCQGLIVAMNISDEPTTLVLPGIKAEIVLSTAGQPTTAAFESQVRLEAREGIVGRIVIPQDQRNGDERTT